MNAEDIILRPILLHMVLMCIWGVRSITKGDDAIATIKKTSPKAHISILEMDHTSLTSVISAVNLFLSKEKVLHGLVNNAGIMATPFEMTADGHEAQWQTNYLAHWVLTSHLLPLMLDTSKSLPPGSVRIMNLTSGGLPSTQEWHQLYRHLPSKLYTKYQIWSTQASKRATR